MRETIAAAATPPGVGALGVLRLTGEGSLRTALAFLDLGGKAVLEPRKATLAGARFEGKVGSSRVDLQACKLEYSIVSPK